MPRGRPPKLVAEVYEDWPIEALPELPPGLKGVYVLYDPDWRPIRIGISGRGKQDVLDRLWAYYRSRQWRHAHHFSVYVFKPEHLFKQAEVLMLRAVGQAIPGNVNAGRFPRTTLIHKPPRVRYPHHFVERSVNSNGTIRGGSLKKYAGRKIRVEIGP